MAKKIVRPPFFEIGPKSYLYGDEILALAQYADKASHKYGVDIIFTCPIVDIRRVRESTSYIHVYAPHMDPTPIGRGLADILPESLVAAGADGVMLNHIEKPLDFKVLEATIKRADEVGLSTIVCADSMEDATKIASLHPDIVVAEPSALIGSGVSVGSEYVAKATYCIKMIDESILVLTAAGISSGKDVYNIIIAGADATGSSSAVVKAPDQEAMVDEMISAVRRAWDARHE